MSVIVTVNETPETVTVIIAEESNLEELTQAQFDALGAGRPTNKYFAIIG
jgi:hypothetical protein